MAGKVHRIHSLPDNVPLPVEGADSRTDSSLLFRGIDAVLRVQRPAVLAHLRSLRLRHPDATTADLLKIVERRYLLAVTTGGAAVGATAAVPGIGTGIALALGGAETVGFLESTALFAQSIAELHGIPVEDPDRARALTMTLMLGKEGTALLSQLAGEAAGHGRSRPTFWGETLTKTLPRTMLGPLVDRLKHTFVSQFAARGGTSLIGRALPFGVGAVVGGTGNHVLGRRVVSAGRKAFGPPPVQMPIEIEPRPGASKLEHRVKDALGKLKPGRSKRP